MSPRIRTITAGIAIVALTSCTNVAAPPYTAAPGELALGYDGGLEIHADGEVIAEEPRFSALAERVGCAPAARRHARRAQRHGRRARGLGWTGGALGVASLGGLGGLAALETNPQLAGAVIGTGAAIGLLGIVLAGASRAHRNRAAGNAVDAVNYYNDEMRAGRCKRARKRVDEDASFEHPTRDHGTVIVGPPPPPNPLAAP